MTSARRPIDKASRRRIAVADPSVLNAALDGAAAEYAAGRLAPATRAYEQIARDHPGDIRAPYSLAIIDIRSGRWKSARKRLQRVTGRAPELFAAWHNLGYASQSLGLWREAAGGYERALALSPDAAETAFSLAVALSVLGRTGDALARYRTLCGTPQHRLRALTRIALLDPAAIADDEREEMRRAAGDPGAAAELRTGLWFALGEAFEHRGLDNEAFAAFTEGNALKHLALRQTANGAASPDAVARINANAAAYVKRTFTPAFFEQHASGQSAAIAPIFIVGMPRSGSTLIEQILSSHRDLQGMGESPILSEVLRGRFPYAPEPPAPDHFARLAEAYLARLRQHGWTTGRRPIDKTLENYLHVGSIQLMFPRAIILHSVRDPIDTCLSCYRQLFVAGNETLYDLRQIGGEYVRYRSLMEHWREVPPGRVIDVDHEALVANSENQIRWLITQACSLDWDPACLRFHENDRAVRTASTSQVRRPIFSSSIARWRRYEAHLEPLFEALGPLAPSREPNEPSD